MSDPPNLDFDALLHRFLEDREGLSDAEFQELLNALRTQPQLAERLKDHLIMDDLLAQQFAAGRQEFIARFQARLQKEMPNAAGDPSASNENPIETYRLSGTEPHTNGESSRVPANGSHQSAAETHAAGTKLQATPPPAAPPPTEEAGHPWRTFFGVMAVLFLIAGGLAWLEFTPAARQVATVGKNTGTAFLYRNGVGYVAAPGMRVLPGDEVRVPENARVTIVYKDQTQIEFYPNTRAELQPDAARLPGMISALQAKEVVLQDGKLKAEVQKQPPGRPMIFKTLALSAKVLGTRLVLAVDGEECRLEVIEGVVNVQPELSEQPSVKVTAGQKLIANKNEFRVTDKVAGPE